MGSFVLLSLIYDSSFQKQFIPSRNLVTFGKIIPSKKSMGGRGGEKEILGQGGDTFYARYCITYETLISSEENRRPICKVLGATYELWRLS